MSGVINAPASTARTLALYKAAAKNVATTGIPISAAGTGGDKAAPPNNTTLPGAPSGTGSNPATNSSLPGVATSPRNAGSALVASSAFALVAAAAVVALAL